MGIEIDSESEDDDYAMKSPKKLSMSPKINIGPMINSEKFHEKSRNSLWEAFITSREKTKTSKSPSSSPRDDKKQSTEKEINATDIQKKSSPPEGVKKAKIGITIKKSPNSDRTFESRLLDQDSEPVASINKRREIIGESETDSVMSEDDLVKKEEEMKKSIFMKRKSNDSLSPSPKSFEESKKKTVETNKKKSPDEHKKKTTGQCFTENQRGKKISGEKKSL